MIQPWWQSECGRFTLYCADCLDVLPQLEAGGVQAVITDPPYGISHSSRHGASWQNTMIAGDSDTRVRDRALDGIDTVAAFGTWKTPPIREVRGVLVWDKGPASGMGDLGFPWKPSWELIYIRGSAWSGRRDEGVLRGPVVLTWESAGRAHPHEKPVWIAEMLIGKLPGIDTIIDPFTGSGTTGVACAKTGRRFIGIEISEDYCRIAKRRIQQAIEDYALFDRAPEPEPQPMLIGDNA